MDPPDAIAKSKPLIIELRNSDNLPTEWTHLVAELRLGPVPDECLIPNEDQDSIENLFWKVIVSLLCMISASLAGTALLLRRPLAIPPELFRPPLGIVAGFLGSSTAALRSALDRHANGIEDKDGHQWPDPKSKKERFNARMAVWFLYRPVLGAVVGLLVYLGVEGNILGIRSSDIFGNRISDARFAFFALVGGLFAKSLLDLLMEKFKQLFSLKG